MPFRFTGIAVVGVRAGYLRYALLATADEGRGDDPTLCWL